jgi:hypothetical protein
VDAVDNEQSAERQQQTGDQCLTPPPIPPNPVPSESHQHGTDSEEQEIERQMSRFERVTISLAIVGTILALGTAVVFYDQFAEMATQTDLLNIAAKQSRRDSAETSIKLEHQLGITQQQATAAQDQVIAARDSVKAIQRQMRQDQRPWIEVVDKAGQISITEGQPLVWATGIANVGKTAARSVMHVSFIEIVQNGSNPKFVKDTDHLPRNRAFSRDFIGAMFPSHPMIYSDVARGRIVPGTKIATEFGMVTKSEVDSLNAGLSYIAIHGFVSYYDIFNVHHWTKFCFWHYVLGGPEYTAGGCTAYNSVDNN